MHDHLLSLRIEDVVVVGRFEKAEMFLDEEDIALQDGMHGQLLVGDQGGDG